MNVAETGTVSVTHADANGTWLIALAGEHDLATAPLLERETSGIWPACTSAVVDLSEAAFIDSSVIHWLLRVRGRLAESGRQRLIVVDGAPGSVAARIIDLTALRDLVPCYATREAALAEHAPSADV